VMIDRSPDEVWSVVGDFGDLNWIPGANSVKLDGDVRIFRLGDSIVKHRLLHRDDIARTYTYTYTLASDVAPNQGEVARTPEATISVVAEGSSASTVTWTSETEERKGSTEGLRAFFQGILDAVKNQLERD
jgi:hypothetical protein